MQKASKKKETSNQQMNFRPRSWQKQKEKSNVLISRVPCPVISYPVFSTLLGRYLRLCCEFPLDGNLQYYL